MIHRSEIYVGCILKFKVASRSYVKKPYYVEVTYWDGEEIETHIPGHHSLRFKVGTATWDYHFPRIVMIGRKEIHAGKLFNQKLC